MTGGIALVGAWAESAGVSGLWLIFGVLAIVKLIMGLAVSVKRLHDSNRPGSMVFMALVPVIGFIYLFVVCGFLAGTDSDNQYGPPPVGGLT